MEQTRLKELLHYDPNTGIFTWRVNRRGRFARKGSVAGTVDFNGYIAMGVDNRRYYAHRLAWLYVFGYYPPEDTDHINEIKTDNRIVNLRCASRSENMRHSAVLLTACKNGHELTPNNLYVYSGRRVCKPCAQRRAREYKKRVRNEKDAR